MSAARFCERRSLWASSLFARKRMLAFTASAASSPPVFVEARVVVGDDQHLGDGEGIVIELAQGQRLIVGRWFDRALLLEVIEAIERGVTVDEARCVVIGLPSLPQLDQKSSMRGTRIWLAAHPADMRCGFDWLADLVKLVKAQGAMSGHLFLFRSRGGGRLKVLYWDKDGYALWYKWLEAGVFKFLRIVADAKSVELRASELAMLLDGIDLKSVKRGPRYQNSG